MDFGVATLLGRLFAEESATRSDRTVQRILDATVEEAATQGLGGLTVDGVAKRAGVNRVTIYRRFGGRDQLMEALAEREGRAAIAAMSTVMNQAAGAEDGFVSAFLAMVRFTRGHPIIARMAVSEPQDLIAVGLAEGALLLRMGGGFVAEGIRKAQAEGLALHVNPEEAGETVARIFATFVLLPGGILDLEDDQALERYVRRTLLPMVMGPSRVGAA
ncbi:TetR/AcrR family transcriptional regulator [Pseudonocardiaceae bacterium YIM PH 21723]|nr:TetR/AcrR family transcriptional regulator [Pseudonocardiaceae bacterium YIM PH 21723]